MLWIVGASSVALSADSRSPYAVSGLFSVVTHCYADKSGKETNFACPFHTTSTGRAPYADSYKTTNHIFHSLGKSDELIKAEFNPMVIQNKLRSPIFMLE